MLINFSMYGGRAGRYSSVQGFLHVDSEDISRPVRQKQQKMSNQTEMRNTTFDFNFSLGLIMVT